MATYYANPVPNHQAVALKTTKIHTIKKTVNIMHSSMVDLEIPFTDNELCILLNAIVIHKRTQIKKAENYETYRIYKWS